MRKMNIQNQEQMGMHAVMASPKFDPNEAKILLRPNSNGPAVPSGVEELPVTSIASINRRTIGGLLLRGRKTRWCALFLECGFGGYLSSEPTPL